MDKELENLLVNYENAIYGQAFPITPSIHQLHLLLDYIANLEQQCKKQKEVIDKIFSRITLWKMEDITMETTKVLDDLLSMFKEVSE